MHRKRAHPGPAGRGSQGVWAGPLAVAAGVVLALPAAGLGYLWDDYIFLDRVTRGALASLTPDPAGVFYRPIPREAYFLLLRHLDPVRGHLGHVINLGVLALSVFLVISLVTKLAGRRAGVSGGLAFASLAALPSLASWVSCAQDLFAIAFLLLALNLREAGRNAAALVAAACALLSKETSVALIPVLAGWDWITNRPARKPWALPAAYAGLTVAWAALHPGIRTLVAHAFGSGATGYVGLGDPARSWSHAGQYALTLLNIPLPGVHASWPSDRTAVAVCAAGLLLPAVLWSWKDRAASRKGPSRLSVARLALLAALLILLPLLLTALMIRHWAMYFACVSGIGFALIAGVLLARLTRWTAAALLLAYLLLGVLCRGISPAGESLWTERVFVDADHAIRRVERNMLKLHPTLPRGSRLFIAVKSTGTRGVSWNLHEGQAARAWYRDPTIQTLRPEQFARGAGPDLLLCVTSALSVVEIRPETGQYGWSGDLAPDQGDDVGMPIRSFARGAAARGETDRAVRILRSIAGRDKPFMAAYDTRLAAMALLAAHRDEEAHALMDTTLQFDPRIALLMVRKILGEPTGSAAVDSAVFEALGVSTSDPNSIRMLMRMFAQGGLTDRALHFARRLQSLAPGDAESAELIEGAGGRAAAR